jgi:alpha-beta hydrolase superfamily lysophospholipase
MFIAIGFFICATLLAAGAIIYGFHLSNLIYNSTLSSRHKMPPWDLIASSEGDGRITLRANTRSGRAMDTHHEGVFGIITASGYGQVSEILERGHNYSIRKYTPMTANIDLAEPARLDIYAHPDNPKTAYGIDYHIVRYTSELGEYPAWFIPGTTKTWAIFAHGRGAHPNEALRIIPTLANSALPILAINYRNDDGSPASPDRKHWLGLTEWRDLEAAIKYAIENGAEDVILYGYSMGGGMCLNLLYESDLAPKVRGVIMNSPLLDFGETLNIVGRIRNYPRPIVRFGKWAAGMRFGIDWQRMNYLNRASELQVPILILHGEKDSLVPAPTSQSLAWARPDIVRYVGFPEAAHARSWNLDPEKYEAAVRQFLREILGESP